MLQTASEIKAQILEASQQEDKGRTYSVKERSDAIELGRAVKNMTGTKGWKIVEAWIMRNLDIGRILNTAPDKLALEHAKAQAFAAIIQQVNYWIAVADKLEEEKG